MQIPFVGGAYTAKSSNLNAQSCINWYPEIDPQNAKHPISLMPTPGLKEWHDTSLGNGYPIRKMLIVGEYLYAVVGKYLYKYDSNANSTIITGELDTDSGFVWMKSNGIDVVIVDPDKAGYVHVIGEGTFAKITTFDADFVVPSSLAYQDGYYIVSESGTDTIYISTALTGKEWDILEYASGEAAPDDVECVFSDQHQLWLLGEKTIEIWYNSGDLDFPFERMSGGVIQRGIGAPASISSADNSFYWIDDSGRACRMNGMSPVNVSTRHIDYQFSKYTLSDAIGWTRIQEGHEFYEITFPTDDATWSYDAATNLWHQKSSFPNLTSKKRHRGNCYANFKGQRLVGDYDNGKIYELDEETYKDDDQEIRRERRTQYVHNDRKRFFTHRLEVEFENGVGLDADDADIGEGKDPQAMLKWSDDGGHSWSNEHQASIGKIGETKNRCVFRRLGSSRERIYELSVTDPVKAVVLGADANITAGIS